MKKELDIVVVGELNVDLILTGLPSLPELGNIKLAQDMHFTLGSASAIFACNISRLGLRVGFMGQVGDDEPGEFILSELARNGVDTSQVMKITGAKTGICVSLSYPGDYAMASYPGVRERMTVSEINMDYLTTASHLHMSSYYLQKGMMDGCPDLFSSAQKMGLTTSLDPDSDPTGKWDNTILKLLQFVDIFLPNKGEALNISNCQSIMAALDYFKNLVKTIVIKSGQEGAWVKTDRETLHAGTFAVDVIDTTGAGDSFNSGFIYKFYQGDNIQECMRWGSACAALSTTELGGIAGFPDLSELERFLALQSPEINQITNFKD